MGCRSSAEPKRETVLEFLKRVRPDKMVGKREENERMHHTLQGRRTAEDDDQDSKNRKNGRPPRSWGP
jgi:hypothetical protein